MACGILFDITWDDVRRILASCQLEFLEVSETGLFPACGRVDCLQGGLFLASSECSQAGKCDFFAKSSGCGRST